MAYTALDVTKEGTANGPVGWGMSNMNTTECVCCPQGPCSRRPGCCSCGMNFFYQPHATDTFTQATMENGLCAMGHPCCSWAVPSASIDGMQLSYQHEMKMCGDQEVVVPNIGKIIAYWFCLPACGDRVVVEAFDNEGRSKYTQWEYGLCDCKRQCSIHCAPCSNIVCCGMMDVPVGSVMGPKETGVDNVVTTQFYRYHMCLRPHYQQWFGYKNWPATATPADKALLVGMLHARLPVF